MGEGECEPLPEEQPKKSRHRKKHLYNTILQQMEFYFSDSNLTKDRFLSELLAKNTYVDIEVFLKFNKIKKLNCTVEDIQKAIRKSEIIELSEDGQKLYRKTPIKVKENVDLCTIYIENIKADATHDTLSQIFSDFGNVVYVSIPKYKHNKVNKGFAFIEYEAEEQANEAISFFESIGCKISSEKNPEELRSIRTFEGDESIKNKEQKPDLSTVKMEDTLDHLKKRKLSLESDSEKKKLKTEDEPSIVGIKIKAEKPDISNVKMEDTLNHLKKEKLSLESDSEMKKLKTEDEASVVGIKIKEEKPDAGENKMEDSSDYVKERKLNSEGDSEKKKSKRDDGIKIKGDKPDAGEIKMEDTSDNLKKRKLSSESDSEKKKIKADDEASVIGNQTDSVEETDGKKKKNKKEKRKNYIKELGMQVLSKREWKKLRNHYLDLQRKKMKEFKQYLNRQKFSQKNYDKKKNQQEEKETIVKEAAKDHNEVEDLVEDVKKLSYVPGVIVKLQLSEPCLDAKKLKNELKSVSPEIKYVDVPLPTGSEEVFLRFGTNDAAKSFCNRESIGEKTLIEGEEEKCYWEKIENDRTVKFQKLAKKQRGREKLLKKAEKESAKHLRFDESDL